MTGGLPFIDQKKWRRKITVEGLPARTDKNRFETCHHCFNASDTIESHFLLCNYIRIIPQDVFWCPN